jgi:membrane protein
VAKPSESAAVARLRTAAAYGVESALYRSYRRFKAQRGTRLAAAVTYSAFLALFPLIAVAAAVAAAALGDSGVDRLRAEAAKQVPGLADKLPLDSLVSDAAAVGVIGGALLIWSGLSWVHTARGCQRTIWAVEDNPGGFVARKAVDLVALAGLGIAAAVSLAASAVTSGLARTVLGWIGIADSIPARWLLGALGVLVGLAVDMVIFAYLLAGIPRLVMPRRILLRTALVAAVIFEITKGLMTSYIADVAGKSIYGAFGVPIAVLVWFNITFQALLFLSAWTATRTGDELRGRESAQCP